MPRRKPDWSKVTPLDWVILATVIVLLAAGTAVVVLAFTQAAGSRLEAPLVTRALITTFVAIALLAASSSLALAFTVRLYLRDRAQRQG